MRLIQLIIDYAMIALSFYLLLITILKVALNTTMLVLFHNNTPSGLYWNATQELRS
ncbi:hypothetical protein K445DRAFT_313905 [Daldinia sp. EC12]|nr:hypothetical protein K445DRAFT_313905 [Daldinia sp. EC12]